MAKQYKAAVIGGSGYGGAEIIRRLLLHPHVDLVRVASIDAVGEPLAAVHPNLEGHTNLRFEELSPKQAAEGVDVVFLGLPHKVSAQKMADLLPGSARVIDLSGDFRLRDAAAYERYYHAKHPLPEKLDGTFVYGLPELNREALKRARFVASPGCFATSVELALLPLARAGLLAGEVRIVGITGSSGSGIAPSAGTHHPVRSQNLKTYKPLEHQHLPEIEQTLRDAGAKDVALRFVPVSAPLSRGIFTTCFVDVPASASADRLRSLYRETYAHEPFVRVPAKRHPEVVAVAGSNFCEVGLEIGEASADRRTVACFAALDNLIKGGAGQAVQTMNVLFGFDERTSLEDPGGWP